MKIVGITGSIASGKSTVTGMFAALGARVLSADEDARAILQPGESALAAVLSAFPEAAAPDGTLNRSRLAELIFSDIVARDRLENITHPAIINRMRQAISSARASNADGILLYETPLLYEAHLEYLFDCVLAVVATTELQTKRLQERETRAGRAPLSQAAVAARLDAQLSAETKAGRAAYVIHTDTTLAKTRIEVEAIWQALHSSQA